NVFWLPVGRNAGDEVGARLHPSIEEPNRCEAPVDEANVPPPQMVQKPFAAWALRIAALTEDDVLDHVALGVNQCHSKHLGKCSLSARGIGATEGPLVDGGVRKKEPDAINAERSESEERRLRVDPLGVPMKQVLHRLPTETGPRVADRIGLDSTQGQLWLDLAHQP